MADRGLRSVAPLCGHCADVMVPRVTCRVSNGLRAAAHHRGRDQPLIVRPAAAPVHPLRHQPGTADRVRPLPSSGPGPERTGGTSGRTRPDRWNIGPVTAHHAGHTGPCRPLVSRSEAAGPSCSPAVAFPGPGQRIRVSPLPLIHHQFRIHTTYSPTNTANGQKGSAAAVSGRWRTRLPGTEGALGRGGYTPRQTAFFAMKALAARTRDIDDLRLLADIVGVESPRCGPADMRELLPR